MEYIFISKHLFETDVQNNKYVKFRLNFFSITIVLKLVPVYLVLDSLGFPSI